MIKYDSVLTELIIFFFFNYYEFYRFKCKKCVIGGVVQTLGQSLPFNRILWNTTRNLCTLTEKNQSLINLVNLCFSISETIFQFFYWTFSLVMTVTIATNLPKGFN